MRIPEADMGMVGSADVGMEADSAAHFKGSYVPEITSAVREIVAPCQGEWGSQEERVQRPRPPSDHYFSTARSRLSSVSSSLNDCSRAASSP